MSRPISNALAGIVLLAATLPVAAADTPATYQTPQDALEALSGALGQADRGAILDIFGTDAEDMLSTGNPQRDAENRQNILTLITDGYRFRDGKDGRVTLLLGADAWPFPIPLTHRGDVWSFDVEAGRDEVFFRRIGLNELDAIGMMKTYVGIQAAFRGEDSDGDGVMEFAPYLLSSSDEAHDGLFWVDGDSPLGARIALASLDGYNDGSIDHEAQPFGGYYYRILHGQSAAAPGGAYDYMIDGNMVAGHAMLAVPADYGNSGIYSFMVSENGVVLQADLGEDSLDVAFGMTRFDPGSTWQPVP